MKQSVFLPVLVATAGSAFALGWFVHPKQASKGSSSEPSASVGSKTSSNRLSVRPAPSSSFSGKSGASPVDQFVARFGKSGSLTSEDMTSAMEALRKENDPILRRKLFTALLEELTPENAKAAYLALSEGRRGGFGGFGGFGRGGGDDERSLLANAWGRIDGPGAVKALAEMRAEREAQQGEGDDRGGRFGRGGPGGGDMRGGGDLVSVLTGWATSDGVGAAKYVNGIEDEREQRMAGFGVVRGMMVNGVEEAMNFISSLPQTEDGGRAQSFYTSMVAGEMLEDGIDSAKAWVDTISDPSLKGGALSRIAESAVREDLEGTVKWITKYAGEESAQGAVSRVANQWAEDDPQAVIAWADSLPDTAKAEAYGQAFEEWARQDPTAAGEYLGKMQASPARDSAVEQYAQNVAREEPATAIQWAETIADQETRTKALTDVARTWYRQDQAAATQWLATSGLPEETVKAVTEAPQRFGFDRLRGGGPGGPAGPGGPGGGGRRGR